MYRIRKGIAPVVYLAGALAAMLTLAAPARAQTLAPELEALAYRVGTWTAVVEWLDVEGRVTRVVPSIREVRVVLGGRALEEHGRLVGTATEVIAIVFFDQQSKRLTEIGVSAPGTADVLHAALESERVTFTAEPRQRGGQTVVFRAVDTAFGKDRYETTGWMSTDGGTTWRQTFRQVNHRVPRFVGHGE